MIGFSVTHLLLGSSNRFLLLGLGLRVILLPGRILMRLRRPILKQRTTLLGLRRLWLRLRRLSQKLRGVRERPRGILVNPGRPLLELRRLHLDRSCLADLDLLLLNFFPESSHLLDVVTRALEVLSSANMHFVILVHVVQKRREILVGRRVASAEKRSLVIKVALFLRSRPVRSPQHPRLLSS